MQLWPTPAAAPIIQYGAALADTSRQSWRVSDGGVTILDLAFGDDRLTLTVARRDVVVPGEEPTFDVALDMRASPFSGRVEQVVLASDLVFLARNLDRMAVPGSITFGGERMPELTLSIAQEQSAESGIVVEATATATSDEWPRLSMLLPGQGKFWSDAAQALRELVERTTG